MKSMKGLGMSKMLGSIRKKASNVSNRTSDGPSGTSPSGTTPAGSPEATAHNSVKAFCESGGKAKQDEVLFLPPIVDAAESSPAAAAECARLIRKYLSKDYFSKPSWQYNAVMLLRILTDNPGPTFTRNLDQKFVDTVRSLLKHLRDPSVRQIVMETLDDFQHSKAYDENLTLLISMWQKEKEEAYKNYGGPQQPMMSPGGYNTSPPAQNPHSQNYFARHHTNKRLPDPIELASRLEEARTSAKLLEQVVMNTPPGEILDNDLIKEFADRCSSASRSIQGYMTSEDPTPDNDTMENLIDTNEQLQTALNQHKRAVLSARKQLGLNEGTDSQSPSVTPQLQPQQQPESQFQANGTNTGHYFPNASSSSSGHNNGKGKETQSYSPPSGPPPKAGEGSTSRPYDESAENPFADPQPGGSAPTTAAYQYSEEQRLATEPFHPGFRPTESYLGRQDSAIGKVHMHGAGASTPSAQPPAQQRLDEVSDDDDIYDAPSGPPPKSKEPMYRY
ncbi:hypothetical protein SNK03_005274 [Fusarium graminearum]|nr:hypothetical protein FG05_08926 [Fusarium graminearum]PCD33936.1 hypothetical protein FGRA07_09091 [Fusarium graminearum]CAG1960049.1 unnamed protein product [Fusarium graminearum]